MAKEVRQDDSDRILEVVMDEVITDPESELAVQSPFGLEPEREDRRKEGAQDEVILDPESDLAVQTLEADAEHPFSAWTKQSPEEVFAAQAEEDAKNKRSKK